jgi:hypothetical protein
VDILLFIHNIVSSGNKKKNDDIKIDWKKDEKKLLKFLDKMNTEN